MSHFAVLVITNVKELGSDDIELAAEKLMEPYSENKRVAEYDARCYCVGDDAKKDVQRNSNKKFGSWDDLRAKFHNDIIPKPTKAWDNMTDEETLDFLNIQEKAWNEYIKEKKQFEQYAFEQHSLKDKPADTCRTCSGKGTFKSIYNPNGKWDYYTIGGRWNGEFHEQGINIFKANQTKLTPFAVVTPDGKWHAKGRMDWWATVSEIDVNWEMKYLELIQQYGDNYAVLIDCHS